MRGVRDVRLGGMLIELLVLTILVESAISECCPPGIVGVHRVIGMHRRLTGA